MKRLFLYFLMGLITSISYSQVNRDGIPFIDHYTDDDYGETGQVWAIEQDDRGIMYFGCNFGLKTFDGKHWESYDLPNSTIIRSLGKDKSGLVYYGAESDFGVLLTNKVGELTPKSLYLDKFQADSIDFSQIWKTLIADNKVYFQSFEKLFYCELPLKFNETDSLLNEIKWIIPDTAIFHLSFSVFDELYIREWTKGLSKIENGKAILIPGGEQFAFLRVYVMLPFDDNKILIGTREAGFFIYDSSKKENAITPFVLNNQDLVINSSLYSGTKLDNERFAIGTFNNGVLIFNKKGHITQILDEKIGLPDNNVLSIFSNSNSSNLWFRTDNGIFKADVSGPFTTWNEKTGIDGVVYDALRLNGTLYVSTNNGLYYLDESLTFMPKFKMIHHEESCWDLLEFKIPGKSKTKLLMGNYSGVYEIEENKANKIGEFTQAYKLYQSKKDSSTLYVGSLNGLNMMSFDGTEWSAPIQHATIKNNSIKSILETEKYLAVGTSTSGVFLLNDFNSEKTTLIDSGRGLPMFGNDFQVFNYKDTSLILSGAGLYFIDDSVAKPYSYFGSQYTNENKGVFKLVKSDEDFLMSVYSKNENGGAIHQLIRFFGNKKTPDTVFSRKLPQKASLFIYPDGEYVWIGNEKGLYKFNKTIVKDYKSPFKTLISKVTIAEDSILFAGNYFSVSDGIYSQSDVQNANLVPVLDFKNNRIVFEWAAAFFENEKETEYSYRLKGETENWAKWSRRTDTRYTNLFEGDYIFEVKAKNIYNTESSIASFSFTILPPWYRTIWAYIIFAILGILAIIIIIKLYTKKLKRENEKLEQTVKERTAEIRMQNEEITTQRDEIQEKKEAVEKAKDKIEKQQKSIMDSIHYASRIQEAVLPPEEYLQDILGEHFVLFKPRDIVSGDFYWATQRGNKTVIAAADCTGHGVPGAFMSMLGISFLNEIVNKEEVLQANVILNRLRENVKRSLRQTGKDNEAKDGMDIALCIIDIDNMQLQYSGAYNPLYIIRNGAVEKVNSDRMPIGIYLREKDSFTNNIVEIKKGDLLFIFSDGYVDQFGGEDDKKITSNMFKNILLENHKEPLEKQKEALVKYLKFWMGHKDKTGRTYKQVDDILVIGIEI